MFIRSLGLRLGQKQQRIQAQVQHDWTDDDIPEVICGVWLKYLLPVTLKGGSTEPLEPPLATGVTYIQNCLQSVWVLAKIINLIKVNHN